MNSAEHVFSQGRKLPSSGELVGSGSLSRPRGEYLFINFGVSKSELAISVWFTYSLE